MRSRPRGRGVPTFGIWPDAPHEFAATAGKSDGGQRVSVERPALASGEVHEGSHDEEHRQQEGGQLAGRKRHFACKGLAGYSTRTVGPKSANDRRSDEGMKIKNSGCKNGTA